MKLLIGVLLSFILVSFLSLHGAQPISMPKAGAWEMQAVKRISFFPLKNSGSEAMPLDEAWWQAREELTASRRFLVASRQFLLKNDVFQPRGGLAPAEALLLARLLDAHLLITGEIGDGRVRMQAYDGTAGQIVWRQERSFQSSTPMSQQVVKIVRDLARSFEAHLPYHGVAVVDPLVGQAVFEEGGRRVVQVDFGPQTKIELGDLVQWIRIRAISLEPVLQGGGRISAFAEGEVVRIREGLATVAIRRAVEGAQFQEGQMVRSEREAERWAALIRESTDIRVPLTQDIIQPERAPMEDWKKENHPVITTLSWIGSIAIFLLLAF
jgi:hypothetical protein